MPEAALKNFLQQHLPAAPAVRRLVIGLSGGADSVALLHAAAAVAPAFALRLRAVHVHHGLSPRADSWAQQAARFCESLAVPLEVRKVEVARTQASLEAAARSARYQAFAAALQADEALVLAQHQGDQAETLVFRLLRGAGLTGLSGMRAVSRLQVLAGGTVPLWRPLLAVPRARLLAYAQECRLAWVEDESNQDRRFARNYLRHEILPRLAQRWPAVRETLAATAQRLQEADDLLQELAVELATTTIDAEQRIVLPALQQLSRPRQRLLLRHWLRQQGFLMPDAAVLDQALDNMTTERRDAMPRLQWAGCELRRYRDRLYALSPLPPIPASWARDWDGRAPLPLPDGRLLQPSRLGGGGPWRVGYRTGGERFRAAPHLPSKELKSLLQQLGVPPWERERLPLIFRNAELVAVAGLALPGADPALSFTITSGSSGNR